MTGFTEDLERNLDQIAEQITPSSTAWETIQYRLAEQTTEPTMEVIMLNPDPREPQSTVSRTALALAAALIVIVGVAAVFLLPDGSDEIDTIDEPEVTVPLELDSEQEPEVIVPDSSTPAAEDGAESEDAAAAGADPATEDAAEPLAMSGDVIADCEFGETAVDPEDLNEKGSQSCVFRDTSVVPFAAEQEFTITIYRDPEFHDPDAGPFVPITGVADSGTQRSPSGFMYAGYLWEGQPFVKARFVGVADGAGPYEGMLIHISGRSFTDDDGVIHMQWVAGGRLSSLTLSGTDVAPAEMRDECGVVAVDEAVTNDGNPNTELLTLMCSASGDSALLPEPRTVEFHQFGNGLFVPTVGDYRYGLTPGSNIWAGVTSPNGLVLSLGISVGEGEFEGLMIHDVRIGFPAGNGVTTGTLRRWALPPAE
jgi:hypothetical protein